MVLTSRPKTHAFEDFTQLPDNPYVRFNGKTLVTTLFFLILAIFVEAVQAQSAQELSDSIRAATEAGKASEALTTLRLFKTENASALALNNFDYLLARMLEQNGDRSAATTNYEAVLERRSPLSQYAIWHLAQIARSTGDLVLERERLRRLIVTAPASLLRDAATVRLAASFSESKDYQGVVSTLRLLTESPKVPLARQALMLTGQAYLQAGKSSEAREVFKKLLAAIPDVSRPDDFALAAVRGLDALEKSNPPQPLLEPEHWQRAAVYQFNRDFDGARVHYLAIVSEFKQSSSVPDALYQIGRGLYQQEKYDDALKYLQRINSQYDSSSTARDALALSAGAYVRQKRLPDAIAAYKQFIDHFPTAPNPERAYLNLIDALRDAGRDEEALSWVKLTRERLKDQLGATLALFSQARIHLAQNSWNAAVNDLNELLQAKDLGGLRVAGGTTPAEVSFLRGYALEQLGRTEESIDSYLAVPEGRNEYYGWRANERLRLLSTAQKTLSFLRARSETLKAAANRQLESNDLEAARRSAQTALRMETEPGRRRELLDMVQRTYASLAAYKFPSFEVLALGRRQVLSEPATKDEAPPAHQQLADELLFLGLYDEGAPELAAARAESQPANLEQAKNAAAGENKGGNVGDAAYTQAVYYLRGGIPYPAVRFAEQTWRAIPSDYLLELAPRELTRMLYPVPYAGSVLKNSQVRQLDPRFVLSIARQETRFQAEAKSVAAARGLMQFIAATAEETARQLGRANFDQDELYNPDTAIQFGSQYLSSLYRQFPNQPQAVAAAYNGGPDNIARWMARSHSQEPDRYVPEIGFAQSKDYVFRVMSNYWVYQTLYNDSLQPLVENR